jgi:murein DD-endopeptidase MepM/ murein hydrolase activator NlpD
VAWTVKLWVVCSLLTLAAGILVMRWQVAAIDTPSNYARVQAQKDALVAELWGLNGGLDDLLDGLMETQFVADEARDLLGLGAPVPEVRLVEEPSRDPEHLHPSSLPILARSGYHVDETLREARALRVSFEEIVAHMRQDAATWACIPSTRPLEHARLTSTFGRRRDPFTGRMAWHRGLDLSAPRGTPVLASAEGRVTRAGYYRGYGKMVEMDHGNGLRTRYAHASRLAVKVGQWVPRGEVLAYVGSTGRANAPHLHYEVHLDGEAVNPEPYMLPEALVAD